MNIIIYQSSSRFRGLLFYLKIFAPTLYPRPNIELYNERAVPSKQLTLRPKSMPHLPRSRPTFPRSERIKHYETDEERGWCSPLKGFFSLSAEFLDWVWSSCYGCWVPEDDGYERPDEHSQFEIESDSDSSDGHDDYTSSEEDPQSPQTTLELLTVRNLNGTTW